MVAPELSIIKHFLVYDNWVNNHEKLQAKDLPKEIGFLLTLLQSHYKDHQSNLTIADLANLIAATPVKDGEYYKAVLGNLETLDVSSTTTEVLIRSYYKHRLLKEISLGAYEVSEGKQQLETLLPLFQQLEEPEVSEEQTENDFVTDDLESLLNDTFRKPGLRWRLATLNRMLGSLRGGDFGFIFARPETGKTTFLASETTYMAQQLSEEDGPILWFNNEEDHRKVKIRCYQATLGAPLTQINANPQAAQNAYLQATKGKHRIVQTSGPISKDFVEKVVQKYKPRLVIYDQIDKIQGFKADRDDLVMGAIYLWARDLAKVYQHAAIGVCQADGTGEGQRWLSMANVANAKTAKQAEADWILGIGKSNDPGYEMVRFMHLSKNKLSGDQDTDPALRHGKKEVLINPSIARYEDLQ